jgi:DNA-binding transcriptional regulator YhcF (GntR family)
MLTLKIDTKTGIPVYKQICRHVTRLINNGRLCGGERLPPERELAERLKVARGTVKKAYDLLAQQKMIVATRGRGSIVVGGILPGKEDTNRMSKAQKKIFETITELENFDLTYREISDLFSLCLAQREEEVAKFRIAAVDCNPEALGIYRQQIAVLTRTSLAQILFSELENCADPELLLAPFDLILTTTNHIEHLRRIVPAHSQKCVPVIVSPTSSTLLAMAKIPDDVKVGVLFQSERFFEIIETWLKKSEVTAKITGFSLLNANAQELSDFVLDKHILVMPPGFAAQLNQSFLPIISGFRRNGGKVIDFAYEMERGSLLHLEDLVRNLLNKTRKSI